MNKKILTVLLALAMMLSMVAPMAVFAEDSCAHKDTIASPNSDGTHDVLCLICEKTIAKNEPCTYVDGACTVCGAGQKCQHASTECVDNGDGTHSDICLNPDCDGYVVATEPHNYNEDGVCEDCGSKKICDHEKTHVVDNKDQTHSLVCDECGEVLEGPVSCIYVNGKCAVCGSEEPAKCEHANKIYTPVADGKTHEVSCADCGETLKQWEAHDFVDGVCSKCGYEEPVEPCKHEHTIWVWDEASGTHYQLCEDCADILTDPEACTYEDGVCTVCGGLEHTEVDPDLDDVPKTGSFFLEWLYSLIF